MSALKPKATRQAFGEALAELGASHPEIVVCEADLGKSTKSEMFGKKFPERYFEMGIAEANMIGTGAGLALSGHTVFVCSFGCFVTGRYDQIRMSVAYTGANVKIIGTHAGVGIGDDGHSQMGLEDASLMRGLPDMMVLQPCDEIETKSMMSYMVKNPGPVYLRLTRQNLECFHNADYQFKPGKLDVLQSGNGIALLATGATVQEAMKARAILEKNSISATVINVPCLKPIDNKAIEDLTKNHSLIVTVEDHYTTGGLGSVVSECLAAVGSKSRVLRLGIQDIPGESGDPKELYHMHGISAEAIADSCFKSFSKQ